MNVTVIMILWLRGSRGKLFYTMEKKEQKKTDPPNENVFKNLFKKLPVPTGSLLFGHVNVDQAVNDKLRLRSLFAGRIVPADPLVMRVGE